jgi:hypothetical protein
LDVTNAHFVLGAFAPNDVTRFFLQAVDPRLISWAVVIGTGNPQSIALKNLEGFLKIKCALPVKIPVWNVQRDNAFFWIVRINLERGSILSP